MSHRSSIKDYDMEEFVTKLTKKKYNAEKEKWPRFRDDFKAKLISEGAELYATLEAKECCNMTVCPIYTTHYLSL